MGDLKDFYFHLIITGGWCFPAKPRRLSCWTNLRSTLWCWSATQQSWKKRRQTLTIRTATCLPKIARRERAPFKSIADEKKTPVLTFFLLSGSTPWLCPPSQFSASYQLGSPYMSLKWRLSNKADSQHQNFLRTSSKSDKWTFLRLLVLPIQESRVPYRPLSWMHPSRRFRFNSFEYENLYFTCKIYQFKFLSCSTIQVEPNKKFSSSWLVQPGVAPLNPFVPLVTSIDGGWAIGRPTCALLNATLDNNTSVHWRWIIHQYIEVLQGHAF